MKMRAVWMVLLALILVLGAATMVGCSSDDDKSDDATESKSDVEDGDEAGDTDGEDDAEDGDATEADLIGKWNNVDGTMFASMEFSEGGIGSYVMADDATGMPIAFTWTLDGGMLKIESMTADGTSMTEATITFDEDGEFMWDAADGFFTRAD